MIGALLRYLFKKSLRDNLPHVRRGYISSLDETDELADRVMAMGIAADPETARYLLKRYKASSAHELAAKMPRRGRGRLKTRVKTLIARMEGAYTSDPHKTEYNRWKKSQS